MKRIWRMFGIVALVATVGVVAAGAVAYAQTGDIAGGPFDLTTEFKEALAGILGISVDEYDAAVDKAQQQVVDQAVEEGWLTQDQAEMMQWRMDQAPDGAMTGMGRGMGGRGHGPGDANGVSLRSIAADKLGMSLTDLMTELQGGKTIAGLAQEKGVDTQTIVDEYAAQYQKTLQLQVENGQITQKMADYQLEQAKTRVTEQLTATWQEFGRGGRHGGAPAALDATTDSQSGGE